MPTLNVSSVLLDTRFADFVTVFRREQVVNDFGEVSTIETPVYGVPITITATESNVLEREDASQYQSRTHTVISVYPFRGVAPNVQPDLVEFQGARFIIDKVEPYSRYGAGFVQARMTSILTVDPEPTP